MKLGFCIVGVSIEGNRHFPVALRRSNNQSRRPNEFQLLQVGQRFFVV